MKPTISHQANPKARSSASFPARIADELRRYDEHLRDVRGLAAGTRKDRLYVTGMLPLAWHTRWIQLEYPIPTATPQCPSNGNLRTCYPDSKC